MREMDNVERNVSECSKRQYKQNTQMHTSKPTTINMRDRKV